MPLCGLLASSSLGWPSIFYLFGGVGIGWSVLWFFLGADRPSTAKFISQAERDYIETNLGSIQSTDSVSVEYTIDFVLFVPCSSLWL